MKKGHFKINLVVICLLMLTLFVACNNNSTPPHEHVYEEAWSHDDNQHWKKATCEHTEEKAELGDHNWELKSTTPATTTTEGKKEYKCSVCDRTKTEIIPMSGSLQFAPEFSIGKTYDRTPVSISSENIVRDGKALTAEEIVSILFKVKDADDNTYTDEAPTNAGEYTVKITAKATEEHEQSVHIEDFVISPKKLSLKIVPTKPYDGKHNMIGVASEKLEGVISPDKPTLNVMMTSLNAGSTYKRYNIIPSSGGNEKNNYIINEEDANLKNASITPLKLNLKGTPFRIYDGTDIIEVKSAGISGFINDDDPTIEIKMTSKNAVTSTKYESAKVVSSKDGYEAINYVVDENDPYLKNAYIMKININLTRVPTKKYDGNNVITVKAGEGNINGYRPEDKPEIIITMASKDVGATYDSHTVIEAGLSESNYTVSESSVADYLKKASITKKIINLPSYSVPVTASGAKNRNFILGPSHGTATASETIVVNYKNENKSWNEGSSFNANSGGVITNIGEINNYSVLMPDESKIKILPAVTSGNNLGPISFSNTVVTKEITVNNKTDVFSFKALGITKNNSYILLSYKDKDGYVKLDDGKLTGVAGDVNILYLHPYGAVGTYLFDCKYNTADFYLHDLDPGKYILRVYLRK